MTRNMLAASLLLVAFIPGEASARSSLSYDAWSLGFLAPNYMEVWVEAAEVEDMNGRLFPNVGGGTASIDYSGTAQGWGHIGVGGRHVIGAALPKRLYVRWQSLVEPQTYYVLLDIPETARRLMLTKVESQVLPE